MTIPTDPMLSSQWHLIQSQNNLFDLNVSGAWQAGYTGDGVRVFVIDDGFDYLHSDLSGNYNTAIDYDFGTSSTNPYGGSSDSHGTAVMGIIGADDNGSGAVGVAFDSEIVGYRTLGTISDAWLLNVRDAITSAANNGGDVVNISQGMANWYNTIFGGQLNQTYVDQIRTSIGTAVDSGRGGLGTIIVKSAGNSRTSNYDVNADMWTNDTRQIVVAAVDQDGTVSSYSSYGAANLISAFGTPGEVVTTDRTGSAGYNGTDYTSGFNGTSSAAPMVSGVVALVLEANASLGWRDVQEILAYTARHVGSAIDGSSTDGIEREPWEWNGADTWNGGGLHYSNDYGFGLIDATAATRLAETWHIGSTAQTSSNQAMTFEDGLNRSETIDGIVNGGITTNSSGTESFTITETSNIYVERVTLEIAISTTYAGDMRIYLISPSGTRSELIRNNGGGADINGRWTFESQEFRGESSAGTWTVEITDSYSGDVLTISDLDLRTYGRSNPNDDRYVFTDSFSDFAGVGGHSTTLSDTDGGHDTINASAVSTGSIINLTNGMTSTIDGVNLTTSGSTIENAVGGVGNDTLSGNHLFNRLYGGNGHDILRGGGGADLLNGGAGFDWVFYDTSSSGVTVGLDDGSTESGGDAQGDILIGIERVFGSSHNDSLTGNAGANILNGNNGHDILRGAGGADQIIGGSGFDWAFYDTSNSAVVVTLGDGSPEVGGHAHGDVLTGIERVFGSVYNDFLGGDSGANILAGNSGHDILRGGAGADRLDGGAGFDWAFYNTSNSAVVVTLSDGSPEIGGHAHGDILVNIERVFGSNYNDFLGGNGGANILSGGNGHDILRGEGGADQLNGGAGFDWAFYNTSTSGVTVILDNSTAETGGHAQGDVLTSIERIFGSSYNDILIGDGANNILNGNNGNDILRGGYGNDILTGGGGIDRFDLRVSNGTNVITDFEDGVDILRVSSGLTFGVDIVASTSGADVLITLAGASFRLEDTNLSEISISDFEFV